MYAHVHSSIIHNSQQVETTQISIGSWMYKQKVIYAYNEYYSVFKRREILTHAIIQTKLEDGMLSKIS